MTYFAKTNTADPRTGFISVGEILTDAQADALGEDKLNELVKRGVLGVSGGAEKPKSEQATPPEGSNQITPSEKSEDNEPEDEPEEAAEDEEAEGDLPTLDAEDVILDEAPVKSATKRGGRKVQ